MMPALAIDKVCCSLKKWIRVEAFSFSLQLQEKEQVNFHSNSFNYTFKCTLLQLDVLQFFSGVYLGQNHHLHPPFNFTT